MIRKAIITGATSHIGLALIDFLLQKSYSIVAIIRPGTSRRNLLPVSDRLELLEAQLWELDLLKLPDGSYDTLYHIGWNSDFENARYNLDGQIKNVDYTLKAAKLACKYGCRTFVGVGSQAECGRITERLSVFTPDNPENAYASAKCIAYQKAKEFCEIYQIKFCWPRLLSTYGPYDRANTLIMSCLNACLNNNSLDLTGCEQIWDYIYITDVANALYLIATQGNHGKKYPIASGIGKPLKEYIEVIAKITGYNRILDDVGKISYTDKHVMYLWGDISELTKDTGFIPEVGFESGIKQTLSVGSFITERN